MSDTKLQELIETLKKQGVERGEMTSREIVEDAQKKADEIVSKARSEADKIVKDAQAEADKRLDQLKSSMEIAASQFVTNLKRVIEESLLALPLKKSLEEALADTEFLKKLLETLVQAYARQSGHKDLTVFLSEEQKEKLMDFSVGLVSRQAKKEDADKLVLDLQSDGVDFGFMVSKADGNVKLDFTAEAFQNLFLRFLTPRFREFFKEIKVEDA
jgi:V/A-type H+-transporting ATPase subunit E